MPISQAVSALRLMTVASAINFTTIGVHKMPVQKCRSGNADPETPVILYSKTTTTTGDFGLGEGG
jgi:hypothetical protein